MTDINLDQVKTNPKFDLRNNFEDDMYSSITHSCKYYEPDELHEKLLSANTNTLSYYSHNIRSLPGHFNDLCEQLVSLYEGTNFKFSIIALQEIWNMVYKKGELQLTWIP